MVYECCDANGMESNVHIRLMVSRGLKPTPYQDPSTTLGMPTIVVLPGVEEFNGRAESTDELHALILELIATSEHKKGV